jgi:hypothetical protein
VEARRRSIIDGREPGGLRSARIMPERVGQFIGHVRLAWRRE